MKKNSGTKDIVFETAVYSREAVELAAYIFSGRCEAEIFPERGATRVKLGGAETDALAGELANEALNQQCRIDLARKNSKIAGMIVTKALLSACGEKRAGNVGGAR